MINCGGTIDLVQVLEPKDNVIFFIIDSHMPVDLCNVYSEKQIRIICDSTIEKNIPPYEDIFDESSDESQGEDEDEEDENEIDDEGNTESHAAKRRRLNEERVMKKVKKREWEKKQQTILFNYEQYSYYGKTSSVIVYEMAWHMSRDNMDMVWWAIIASTEQAILNKVESSTTVLESGDLQGHVSRLSRNRGGNTEKQQLSTVKISFNKDLQLALYRHWSVENSLKHSIPTSVALRLWSTTKGDQRLKKLLADMGLPLVQARQKFSSMDLSYRNEFKEMFEKLSDKYNLSSTVGTSFFIQYGYRFKYCAADIVYAILATLESNSRDKSPQECFLEAGDCLIRSNKDILDKGLEKAKIMLTDIFKTAQSILELKQVVNAGSFLHVSLSEGSAHSRLLSHPHAILLLANFVLRAYVDSSRSRMAKNWPLVASSIISGEENMCLIVGIPPTSEEQPRRFV